MNFEDSKSGLISKMASLYKTRGEKMEPKCERRALGYLLQAKCSSA